MDDQSTSGTRLYRTRLLISFLSLLFMPLTAWAQLQATVEVNPSFMEVGDFFSVKFIFTNDLTSQLSMTEPDLPEGIEKAGESLLSFDTKENQTKVEFYYQTTGQGFLTIPPFTFREGRREEWQSDAMVVGVSVNRKGSEEGVIPLGLSLNTLPPEIYQYQSIGLGLFLGGNRRIRKAELLSVQANFSKSWRAQKIPLFYEMQTQGLGLESILERPLLNWIITPLETGGPTLPTISLQKGEHTLSVSPPVLQVKPLPENVESRAVGHFDITTGISKREIAGSDTVEVTIALTGEGNFNTFLFPELVIEQGVLVGFHEENTLKPTEAGWKGSLFRVYRVALSVGAHQLHLTVPEWSYWDLEQDQLVILEPTSYSVFLTGAVPNKSRLSLMEQGANLALLTEKEMSALSFSFFFLNSLTYLALIPGLVLGAFLIRHILYRVLSLVSLGLVSLGLVLTFWIGQQRVMDSQDLLGKVDIVGMQGQEQESIEEIETLLDRSLPAYCEANLLYNKGILLFALDRREEAIFSLYETLNLAPLHLPAQTALNVISSLLGSDEIISFQEVYWLNWLFVAALLTFNLLWASCFFLRRERVSRFFATLALSLVLIVELSFMARLGYNVSRPLGVVHGSMISISKVPDLLTRSWIFVNGGLAVYLLEESDLFYRILLPSGIQGWINRDSVWTVR